MLASEERARDERERQARGYCVGQTAEGEAWCYLKYLGEGLGAAGVSCKKAQLLSA